MKIKNPKFEIITYYFGNELYADRIPKRKDLEDYASDDNLIHNNPMLREYLENYLESIKN